ncbi:MAG: hypothetical protein JO270_06045 [Acidobacteriaceae bacterium]|nr:hypothetical protein [Acidobacteriaceae bacterium]
MMENERRTTDPRVQALLERTRTLIDLTRSDYEELLAVIAETEARIEESRRRLETPLPLSEDAEHHRSLGD